MIVSSVPEVRWVSGLILASRFYHLVVGPRLGDQPHAACLLGDGSEVLGYDDEVSTDHDFGPRLQLFMLEQADAAAVHALLIDLPEEFDGFRVVFIDGDRCGGLPHHQVEVTTAEAFFTSRLGVDPANGMSVIDWLLTPTQILASLTSGAVFHDPDGTLARRRAVLRWYPDDIWRYALAAGWLRLDQEEAYVGRAGGSGDDLGSRIVAARLVRELVRLAYLIERRWAPYSKWLGRAFGELPLAGRLGPHLIAALVATRWQEREAALCAAMTILGEATNDLGLSEPVDPAPHRFHGRDIWVVAAERFTTSLTEAIADLELRALIARLGFRRETMVGRLPGTIDQAVDSTDILSHPHRCRSAAATLGLLA
jgi:Domain of unknown function (DUF4037)